MIRQKRTSICFTLPGEFYFHILLRVAFALVNFSWVRFSYLILCWLVATLPHSLSSKLALVPSYRLQNRGWMEFWGFIMHSARVTGSPSPAREL